MLKDKPLHLGSYFLIKRLRFAEAIRNPRDALIKSEFVHIVKTHECIPVAPALRNTTKRPSSLSIMPLAKKRLPKAMI